MITLEFVLNSVDVALYYLIEMAIALGFFLIAVGFIKNYQTYKTKIDLLIGTGFIITAIGRFVFFFFIESSMERLWMFEIFHIEYIYALIVSIPFIGLICKSIKTKHYGYAFLFFGSFINYAIIPMFVYRVYTPYDYGPQCSGNPNLGMFYLVFLIFSILGILQYEKVLNNDEENPNATLPNQDVN